MKLLINTVVAITCLVASYTTQAAEILCKGAFVDTIAVEAKRSEATQIQQSLLISFKDAQGNHHNCDNNGDGNGEIALYVYLHANNNEAVFNAMTSLAFMARANDYQVNYMINTGKTVYSAEELSYIQIVEDTAIPNLK